ncbi:uncharacterized protein [Diadema antillarum]|uniref:uncharacterized protein n=1 Tax=Diadema antillarum TaxID=105358 RepID=UPI003A85DC39
MDLTRTLLEKYKKSGLGVEAQNSRDVLEEDLKLHQIINQSFDKEIQGTLTLHTQDDGDTKGHDEASAGTTNHQVFDTKETTSANDPVSIKKSDVFGKELYHDAVMDVPVWATRSSPVSSSAGRNASRLGSTSPGDHPVQAHGVAVPVPALVMLCVFVEACVLAAFVVAIISHIRRLDRKKDAEKGANRLSEKVEEIPSVISTSTPQSQSRVCPGLTSALSDNLQFVLPVSPIDPLDRQTLGSLSAGSGTPCVPADARPKKILGALSEDRQRSSTWLTFTPDSKRALFAMTRSKSNPEQLYSLSMSSDGHEIETAIGKIDPSVYKRQEELVAKYVGKWKQKSKKEKGKISFKVSYDFEIELLTVFVAKATDLPVVSKEFNGDVFIKVALDPDHKKRSMSSSILRGTRSPNFSQNFAFRIAKCALADMNVILTVCEYDRYSHPIPVGHVTYSLTSHDFAGTNTDSEKLIWLDLEKPDKDADDTKYGELLISLTYLPNAERVNLIIMKAQGLRLKEWGDKQVGKSILDTFVKITIMRCGKVMKHKNTKVVRRSCSPIYNEAFSIDRMRLSEMPECCFVLSVCVRLNHFRSHRVIGRCVVGGKDCAVGDGLAHWNDMSDSPRSIVARWHKIQK